MPGAGGMQNTMGGMPGAPGTQNTTGGMDMNMDPTAMDPMGGMGVTGSLGTGNTTTNGTSPGATTAPAQPRSYGKYLDRKEIPTDPWGNPYKYEWPTNKGNGKKPAIWSLGPNKTDDQGNEDDIINWDPNETVANPQNTNTNPVDPMNPNAGMQNPQDPFGTGANGMQDPFSTGAGGMQNPQDPFGAGGMGQPGINQPVNQPMPNMNQPMPNMNQPMPNMNQPMPNMNQPTQPAQP